MNDGKKALGIVSALATYLLLMLVAIKTQTIPMVWNELGMLVSGGVLEIAGNHTTFLMMFPVIIATVVLELPFTIGAEVFQTVILGKSDEHALSKLFDKLEEGNHFFTFFIIMLLEELFARWFFLGLFTKIPLLSGVVAFYVLFLIGNGLWALIHLSNFKRKKDRKTLRVLPPFVAGVFFTYIFVKYGLLATVLTHFASNAVICALHKVQKTNVIDGIDGLIMGYTALCGAVSYWLMAKPLTDVLIWFVDKPTFILSGWEFWDYVKVSIFLSSCIVVLFDCLLYDRDEAGKKKSDKKEVGAMAYLIILPIVIGLLFGLYSLLGLFIANVPYRILVSAILFTFLQRDASGSAISRTFWTGLPNVYITMCILQALGFWLASAFVLAEAVIEIPRIALKTG